MATIADIFPSSNQKNYPNPPRQALRVFASANKSSFYFRIADYTSRALIGVDGGPLPDYYAGLRWTESTALLYALARASEWIKRGRPDAHVAMICCQPFGQKGRGQRWAA